MRILLIVSFLFSLVLIALLIIMMEQNKVLVLLNNKTAQLKIRSDELDFQLTNEDFIKATVEKLVTLGNTLVEDTEGAVAKLLPEVEKAKTENDACQADKKTKDDELANIQNEQTKTEDALKTESDAWKKEIDTLTAQLFGHTEICDYVKKNTLAVKLCTPKLEDQTQETDVEKLTGTK